MSSKPNNRDKFHLFGWMQRRRLAEERQAQAQAALDSASSAPPKSSGKGSLYRFGCTLADLNPGECGTVRVLVATANARLRLLEMGLTPGTHIKVLRAAAFGGPLDILVRGYQLSLRREEAAAIWLGEDGDEED